MTEIKIKDLRGVGDVELTLDDSKRVFVFFGSNGVGKTKTLEALLHLYLAKLANANYKNRHVLTPLFSYLSFKNISIKNLMNEVILNFYSNVSKNYHNDDLYSLDSLFNKITVSEKNISAIAYLGANLRGRNEKNNTNNKLIGSSEQRKEEILEGILNDISNNSLYNLGMNQNINQWFTERAKSVNPYQKEEDNRKVDIDTVLNALNILDSRIEKTLKIDGDGNVFLTVEGQERELSELSSGFISVVKIIQSIISAYSAFTNATDLLNVKGVVLIDEIESHLHIEWQTKIVPTLKSLFPNTTFYIATHSPLVLSQLDEGEAYLLKREGDVVRSEVIDSPNKRLLIDVLKDAFDVDLNRLKRDNMAHSDQTLAKQRLLDLLGDD